MYSSPEIDFLGATAQLTACFRYLARYFKTKPTGTVRSVLETEVYEQCIKMQLS
jgi:hypothetical protein